MVYAEACMEEKQTIAPARIEKDRMMFLTPRYTCMDHSKLHARGMTTLMNVGSQSLQSCKAIFQYWNILPTFITLGFHRDCRDCLMYRHKKTGPKAGFSFLDQELLLGRSRSRSGSISSGASSLASCGCCFASSSSSVSSRSSSVSSSFASLDSSFASLDSSFASLDSGFSSRRLDGSSGFFFLAAGAHGNGQQSSQEDGIFHLISLYLQI
jgi:hypothetical protein